MATLIITEKASQARDLRAALGVRFGQILPAEGHLLRLAEPEEVNPAWKSWSCAVLKPDGLYPTRPAAQGNKPAKLKAIASAPSFSSVRRAGRCDCSTSRMISSFSEAGYLIPRCPHPRSCFFLSRRNSRACSA